MASPTEAELVQLSVTVPFVIEAAVVAQYESPPVDDAVGAVGDVQNDDPYVDVAVTVFPLCCVAKTSRAELFTFVSPTAPVVTLVPGRAEKMPLKSSTPPLFVMSTPAHSTQTAFMPDDEFVIVIVAEISVDVAIFVHTPMFIVES